MIQLPSPLLQQWKELLGRASTALDYFEIHPSEALETVLRDIHTIKGILQISGAIPWLENISYAEAILTECLQKIPKTGAQLRIQKVMIQSIIELLKYNSPRNPTKTLKQLINLQKPTQLDHLESLFSKPLEGETVFQHVPPIVTSSERKSILIFRSSGESFGCIANQVVEISANPKIESSPGRHKSLLGLVVTRGRAIPVFSLNQMYPNGQRAIVIIIKNADQELGIYADEVDEVLNVSMDATVDYCHFLYIKDPFRFIGSIFESIPVVDAA